MSFVSFWKKLPVICWYIHKMQEDEEETIAETRQLISESRSDILFTKSIIEKLKQDEGYGLVNFITDEEERRVAIRRLVVADFHRRLTDTYENVTSNQEIYSQRAGEESIDLFVKEYLEFHKTTKDYLAHTNE